MLNDHAAGANFEQVEAVGVAIRRSRDATQWHVGFLYRFNNKAAKLRHQCHANAVLDEDPDPINYLWLDIAAIPRRAKRVIAGKLARAGGDKVPYGVGYAESDDYIDKNTLRYINTTPGRGLTCSSYLLAVFKSLGYMPVTLAGWESRTQDEAWQMMILDERIRVDPDNEAHYLAEKNNVGTPRVRPDQVAGACVAIEWPINQANAETLAASVAAAYETARPMRL